MQHPADSRLTASPTATAAEKGSQSLSQSPEPPCRRRPKRPGAGGRKTEKTRKNGNGKNITLEDLRAHFRLSLGEAAQRLGVCASTLKRVCRRKGIPAWPQRKLVKLSRAVDQVSAAHKGLSPSAGLVPDNARGTHPDEACYASQLASAYYNGFEDEGADSEHPAADLPHAAPLDLAHLPPRSRYEQAAAVAAQPDPGWSPFEYSDEGLLRRLPPRLSGNHSYITASRSADLGHLSRVEGHISRAPDVPTAGNQRATDFRPGVQASVASRHPPPLNLGGRSYSYSAVNTAPRHLSTGSVHSEYCSWPPSHPNGSAAPRIPVISVHSPIGAYLPHVHSHAATVPSSLSLPELRVNQAPEDIPPYKHRRQHSSSSGEEGAFPPDSRAASRFPQLRHAPLLGANEDLAAAHHLAPSVAAELGSFHRPHADESVVQTPAFNSIPALRSGALQHGSISDPAFRNTVAGSLGGIGPGFAGGSGAFGGPRYGAPGYTSSGYHGMQLSAVCSDIARQLASWRTSPHPVSADSAHATAAGDLGRGLHHGDEHSQLARADGGRGNAVSHGYHGRHSFPGVMAASTDAPVDAMDQDRAEHNSGDACQEQALHLPTVAAAFASCTSPANGELGHDGGLPSGQGDALW